MFSALIAEASEIVNGTYPGGASADDPVPVDTAYYSSPWGYGITAMVVLAAALWLVTRLNRER